MASENLNVDRHRDSIVQALNDAGLTAVKEVGLSGFKVDIALYDPAEPSKAILGLLLDGARWNSRDTVSDRDSLPVAVLKNKMGWTAVNRVWLPSWLTDPQGEVQRITQAFEEAKVASKLPKPKRVPKPKLTAREPTSSPSGGTGASSGTRSSVGTVTPGGGTTAVVTVAGIDVTRMNASQSATMSPATMNPFHKLLDSTEEWQPLGFEVFGSQDTLDYLHDTGVQGDIRSIVEQLTEQEGPVSTDRLAKFVASCFGFNRVVGKRIAAINAIGYPGHERDDEGFLYPQGTSVTDFSTWKKGTNEEVRVIGNISLGEIGNALVDIARVAHGIREEQLLKETSLALGTLKLTDAASTRMDAALALALRSGRLVLAGDYIRVRP
jgi:hypothetical protein